MITSILVIVMLLIVVWGMFHLGYKACQRELAPKLISVNERRKRETQVLQLANQRLTDELYTLRNVVTELRCEVFRHEHNVKDIPNED